MSAGVADGHEDRSVIILQPLQMITQRIAVTPLSPGVPDFAGGGCRPFMNAQRPRLLLVALAYLGFVSLGLPDAVIGVAWPGVRDYFTLPQAALGLVFIAAGCGYFSSS